MYVLSKRGWSVWRKLLSKYHLFSTVLPYHEKDEFLFVILWAIRIWRAVWTDNHYYFFLPTEEIISNFPWHPVLLYKLYGSRNAVWLDVHRLTVHCDHCGFFQIVINLSRTIQTQDNNVTWCPVQWQLQKVSWAEKSLSPTLLTMSFCTTLIGVASSCMVFMIVPYTNFKVLERHTWQHNSLLYASTQRTAYQHWLSMQRIVAVDERVIACCQKVGYTIFFNNSCHRLQLYFFWGTMLPKTECVVGICFVSLS